MGAFFSDFTYGKVALSFTVASLGSGVASSPGSLPGDEATLGGAPIRKGAGTYGVLFMSKLPRC